jgi:hypothetical protein
MGMRVLGGAETRYFNGFASLSPGCLRPIATMRIAAIHPARRVVAY